VLSGPGGELGHDPASALGQGERPLLVPTVHCSREAAELQPTAAGPPGDVGEGVGDGIVASDLELAHGPHDQHPRPQTAGQEAEQLE
jgi:hypothetical protein